MGATTVTTTGTIAATTAPSRHGTAAKLAAVIKREFTERVRTRAFVLTTLLGPVFFAGLSILPAWLASREQGSAAVAAVTIVDATGSNVGDRIARTLTDSLPATTSAAGRPTVVHVDAAGIPGAEQTATAAVVRKEREGVLVLDSATLAGNRARYVGRNATSMGDMQRLRDVVRREVLTARLERAGFPAERVAPITAARLHLVTTSITDRGAGGSGVGGAIVAIVVAILLYATILLFGQQVLRSVVEEKTTRVAEVIVASVKPDILMAGKVLGVGAVGLLQQVLWFGGGLALVAYVLPFFHLDRQGVGAAGAARQAAQAADATASFVMPEISIGTIGAALLFFLLGYLLYSALFAAAGAMCNSDQEAQQAAIPVMLPLIGSAVFMQLVLQNPESGPARAFAWFPLTAPIIMPMRMALVSTTPLEVTLVALGVAVAAVLALWLGARIYRVGLLMYGKRPSVVELARWMRQAA